MNRLSIALLAVAGQAGKHAAHGQTCDLRPAPRPVPAACARTERRAGLA